jgi:hypothetical protein
MPFCKNEQGMKEREKDPYNVNPAYVFQLKSGGTNFTLVNNTHKYRFRKALQGIKYIVRGYFVI